MVEIRAVAMAAERAAGRAGGMAAATAAVAAVGHTSCAQSQRLARVEQQQDNKRRPDSRSVCRARARGVSRLAVLSGGAARSFAARRLATRSSGAVCKRLANHKLRSERASPGKGAGEGGQ